MNANVNQLIDNFEHENLSGISTDMNFLIGLNSLLDLIDQVQPRLHKFTLLELIRLQNVTINYCKSFGLIREDCDASIQVEKRALEKLLQFRSRVRSLALSNMKSDRHLVRELLNNCDEIREQLKQDQVFVVDKKV
jgi:cysteinyl-tRNA synthetase